MKKLIFALVAFGAIVSQSSSYDVCAGDFLEKYERKLEAYENQFEQGNAGWRCCGVDSDREVLKKKMDKIYESKQSYKDKAFAFLRLATSNGKNYDFTAGVIRNSHSTLSLSSVVNDYSAVKEMCSGVSKKMAIRYEFFWRQVSDYIAIYLHFCSFLSFSRNCK